MYRKTVVLGAIASTLIALTSAQAGDRYFHIDRGALDSSYGINETLSRIESFAESQCDSHGRRPLWVKRAEAECAVTVRTDIIAHIDDRRLTAAAEARRFADIR